VSDRRVRQQALDVGLRDRDDVPDGHRQDGQDAEGARQSIPDVNGSPVWTTRSSAAKAAALVPAAMSAAIGVGAPW
jgi:hypothetical protein